MRRLLRARRAPATALGIVAVIVAAGGGAYAAKSGGGTITVCIHHHGGGLYKAHKCARHDAHQSWNARGPQGPKGDTGIQGPKGDTGTGTPGPAGPSVAGFAVSRPQTPSALPSDASYGSTVTLNTGADHSGP